MEKILIKWVHEVNWRYIDEWTYSSDGWEVLEDYEKILYKKVSSENEIIKNLLTKDVKYRVKFEIINDSNDDFFGSIRMNVGGYLTPYYSSVGEYEYISSNPTWTSEFRIISQNSNTKLGIKNLIIESISYEEIDLYEDSQISLTYSISDIREYYNRMGVYSKNIVVPGTERNLKFFGYIHDDDIISKININKKFNAVLKKDEIIYNKGYIFIESVDRYDDRYEININFYGEQLNLFKEIGDDLLEDMDWSELNHTYTRQFMTNSWAFPASVTNKIVYPWLDYGNKNWSLGGCVGRATDKTPSLGLVGRDFYPGISLKYILDEIIRQYGFNYEFSLSDEDWFKKIFIPYCNEREKLFDWNLTTKAKYHHASFSNSNIGNNNDIDGYFKENSIKFYQSGIITSYNPTAPSVYRWIENEIELYRNFNYGLNFKPYSTYNSTIRPEIVAVGDSSYINFINPEEYQVEENVLPGSYLIRQDGRYKFKMKFKSLSTFQVSAVNEGLYKLNVYLCKINKNDIVTSNPFLEGVEFVCEGIEEIYKLGYYVSNLNVTSNMPYDFKYLDEEGNIINSVPNNTNIILEKEIDCYEDEIVYFKFVIVNEIEGSTVTWKIIPDYFEAYEWEWGEGNEVLGKNIIPENIKIKDFLKDIITLFNLYIDVDTTQDNKIILQTRNDYYSGGTFYDLTHKIDYDNKIELKLPSDFQNTINVLKYKEFDDYFTNEYKQTKDVFEIGYGSKRFLVDNDNISGINENSLSCFYSSPVWSVWGINGANNKEQFVMTSFWKKEYPATSETEMQTINTNIGMRLLFFNRQLIYDNNFVVEADKTTFLVNADADYYYDGMGKWYYPYAGHILYPYDLENVNNYDLNFKTALYNKNIYQKTFKGYPETSMTQNNLFNLYYLDLYNQLTSKNSRLLTGYFKLDVNDIQKMTLNSTIQLNNTLYLINKIEDFNPSSEQLTKVELLKIIDKVYPTYDTYIVIDKPTKPFIHKEPNRDVTDNYFDKDNYKLKINDLISINQISRIDNFDENAIYINNLKIKEGEILLINKNVDGGLIEKDGVFNPILFREKHGNDSGLIEEENILYINVWKLRDGGLI